MQHDLNSELFSVRAVEHASSVIKGASQLAEGAEKRSDENENTTSVKRKVIILLINILFPSCALKSVCLPTKERR